MNPSRAWRSGALAAMASAFMLSAPAVWAQVSCSTAGAVDTDGDGFTDAHECTGIATLTRPIIGDPNVKDLFIILAPAASGSSLLPAEPFGQFTAYGVPFNGFAGLGVRVQRLDPAEVASDRTISTGFTPKAVKVTESLDVSGTILGNCQWGTPLGLDGCIVYTKRTENFIASTCGSATIQTPSGMPATAADVLLAYSTYLILHEAGHSLGGLTSDYNSRFGGYHYKPGAGFTMEQAVTYSVKGGKCTFYISPNWNQTLDPPAVKLK